VLAQALDELSFGPNRPVVVAPSRISAAAIGTLRRPGVSASSNGRSSSVPFVHDAAQERDLATA
jgi:hypothetical protein